MRDDGPRINSETSKTIDFLPASEFCAKMCKAPFFGVQHIDPESPKTSRGWLGPAVSP